MMVWALLLLTWCCVCMYIWSQACIGIALSLLVADNASTYSQNMSADRRSTLRAQVQGGDDGGRTEGIFGVGHTMAPHLAEP